MDKEREHQYWGAKDKVHTQDRPRMISSDPTGYSEKQADLQIDNQFLAQTAKQTNTFTRKKQKKKITNNVIFEDKK